MRFRSKQSGFTLIELSIVLVIIGLIVGGVLVGRDLITAAKVRKQITQIEQFNTATNTFENKYGCLPGDCANAFVRFGLASYTNDGYPGTTYGNGDGIISCNATPGALCNTGMGGMDDAGENVDYWQHLVQAHLLAPTHCLGAYWPPLCTDSSGGWYGGNPGIFSPNPVMDFKGYASNGPDLFGGALLIYNANYNSASTTADQINSTYAYEFVSSASQTPPNLLRPVDVRALDQKIDDGLPYTGIVRAEYESGGWGVANYKFYEEDGYCTQATSPPTYLGTSDFTCFMIVQAAF